MADMKEAYGSINQQIINILTPLLTDGTINQLVTGAKTRGSIKPPSLGIIPLPMELDETMLGSTHTREAWNYEIRIRSLVKDIGGDPNEAMNDAVDIISEARNLILADRKLGLPNIVMMTDSKQIIPVPFPIGKKTTLYAADCIFKILFYINNE